MKQLLAKVTTAATVLATPTLALAQLNTFNTNDIGLIERLLRPIVLPEGQAFSLSQLAVIVLNFLIFIAAVIAILYLIWAGIKYITASTDPEKAKEARQAIFNAIIGIVVIILSFAIIQIVAGLAGNVAGNVSQSSGGGFGGTGQFFR